MTQLPVSAITIGERRREDSGDLDALAASIGVAPKQLREWMDVARVPEAVFNACVEDAQQSGKPLSSSRLLRKAGLSRGDYRKVPIDPAVRWAVWERDDFTCHYCGARQWLSVDHLVPESAGGDGTEENFVTACRRCNSAKGVKSYDLFLEKQPLPIARSLWEPADYTFNIARLFDLYCKPQAEAFELAREYRDRYPDECRDRFGDAPTVDAPEDRRS